MEKKSRGSSSQSDFTAASLQENGLNMPKAALLPNASSMMGLFLADVIADTYKVKDIEVFSKKDGGFSWSIVLDGDASANSQSSFASFLQDIQKTLNGDNDTLESDAEEDEILDWQSDGDVVLEQADHCWTFRTQDVQTMIDFMTDFSDRGKRGWDLDVRDLYQKNSVLTAEQRELAASYLESTPGSVSLLENMDGYTSKAEMLEAVIVGYHDKEENGHRPCYTLRHIQRQLDVERAAEGVFQDRAGTRPTGYLFH